MGSHPNLAQVLMPLVNINFSVPSVNIAQLTKKGGGGGVQGGN